MSPEIQNLEQPASPRWTERLRALRNIPPVFRMVWDAAPGVVISSLIFRLLVSLVPVAMLWVTKMIIDAVDRYIHHVAALPKEFWWLVAAEFALASLGTIFARANDFCDTVLADRFTRHISTRIMDHASRLDLTRFEDPAFYDKMDRARVQGTDRVMMIQMSGRLVQEVITTVTLAAGVFVFSPWLLFFLVICVVPAFLGETHFAFLGYSLNFAQTPARRQLDYLRILGGSKESAKELKLFGLGPFLVGRYRSISERLHRQTVDLARRKLYFGALLTLLGTLRILRDLCVRDLSHGGRSFDASAN